MNGNVPKDPYQGFPSEPWYPNYADAGTFQEVSLAPQTIVCHTCGIEGHKSPGCPTRKLYFILYKKYN